MTTYAEQREAMVDSQIRTADVTEYPLIAAMLEIPRERFVPESARDVAYADAQIEIAPGRVMLAPRDEAKLLDILDIAPDELVLYIGAGLGYGPAVAGRLAEAVVAVEEDPALAEEAQRALADVGADNAAITVGPLAAGDPAHGPYDKIVIGGGVEVLPEAIAEQLREGGRIALIRREGALGRAELGIRHRGRIEWRFAFNAWAPVLPGFERAPEFVF